jgi:hypothetical protein
MTSVNLVRLSVALLRDSAAVQQVMVTRASPESARSSASRALSTIRRSTRPDRHRRVRSTLCRPADLTVAEESVAREAEVAGALDEMGYRGDYSFEVFNDDYRQLPLPVVAQRARKSVKWITARVARRSLPARRQA